jgi:hypothetical protein
LSIDQQWETHSTAAAVRLMPVFTGAVIPRCFSWVSRPAERFCRTAAHTYNEKFTVKLTELDGSVETISNQ